MIRIHLDSGALGRVGLRPAVPVPIEALVSLKVLRRPDASVWFGRWQRQMAGRLGRETAPLLSLVAPHGRPPDFLGSLHNSLAEHLDWLDGLSPAVLRRDLANAPGVVASGFSRRLADGDREARGQLRAAVASYHRLFTPDWAGARLRAVAENDRRHEILATRGAAAVLDSLHPSLRRTPDTIEIRCTDLDLDVDLAGGEIILVPSVFLWERPAVAPVEGGPCYITYPVPGAVGLNWPDGSGHEGDALVDLLGRTRAAVLRAVWEPCTTSELAARVGISVSNASEHAAVLRRSGLTETRREGRAVRHTLTGLGRSLLEPAALSYRLPERDGAADEGQ